MTNDKRANRKARNNSDQAPGKRASRRGTPANRQWGSGHLVAALLVGIVIGFAASAMLRPDPPQPTRAVSPAMNIPASANSPSTTQPATDAFGRSPGDEHYGHTHP